MCGVKKIKWGGWKRCKNVVNLLVHLHDVNTCKWLRYTGFFYILQTVVRQRLLAWKPTYTCLSMQLIPQTLTCSEDLTTAPPAGECHSMHVNSQNTKTKSAIKK